MKIFLARQPILDRSNKLFGYELLFRDGEDNRFPNINGDVATIEVIKNSFFNMGINKVTQGKKAFINFTENILKSDIFYLIDNENTVVEILENIEPDNEVLKVCEKLRKMGFIIALDDFVYDEKYMNLMDLANIIKVDFSVTKGYERESIIKLVNSPKVKFLAEKIETLEEYKQALDLGYSYFQGYYFSKPIIITQKKISGNQMVHLKILNKLHLPEFDLEAIEAFIKKDMSLSVKLLRLINSSYYNFANKIDSLKQALVIMGQEQIKRWLYIVTLKEIGECIPDYLVISSIQKAHFCESLTLKTIESNKAFSAFLIGLLEKIDILLGVPFEYAIEELTINDEVKKVLLGDRETYLGKIKKLADSYENGDWNTVEVYGSFLGLKQEDIVEAYIDSIDWVTNF